MGRNCYLLPGLGSNFRHVQKIAHFFEQGHKKIAPEDAFLSLLLYDDIHLIKNSGSLLAV